MDDLRKNDDVVTNLLDGDSPIFDPVDWRLSDFEAALCAETRPWLRVDCGPRPRN